MHLLEKVIALLDLVIFNAHSRLRQIAFETNFILYFHYIYFII